MATYYKIDPEVEMQWNELKLKKKYRYFILKLQNKSVITIETVADRNSTYYEFITKLPENEPRYAVFDYDFHTADGEPRNKKVFIFWCPNEAIVNSKVSYEAANKTIQDFLKDLGLIIYATDPSEMTEDQILSALLKV